MNSDNKKLIIFKKDIPEDEVIRDKLYVKFLDKDSKYAIFYLPLIAPKNLKSYIYENEIEEAYEVSDENTLKKYEDVVYTFKKENGVFNVTKGIELVKKKILLVDNGMDICLNLPKYYYDINGPLITITPMKNSTCYKSYCYVEETDKINPELSRLMIDVTEAVPGILRIDSCYKNSNCKIKNMTRKRPK